MANQDFDTLLAARGLGPYLGITATRGMPCQQSLAGGTATWMMSRSPGHIATEDIVNPTIVFGNFSINSSNVESSPGAGQIKMGIELPDGSVILANENAGGLAAMPAGIVPLTFNTTIKKGTSFGVRILQVNTNGVVFRGGTGSNQYPITSGFIFGTGTPNDLVAGGAVADGSGAHNQCVLPLAILSQTRRPSFLIFGTSRPAASSGGAVTDRSNDIGEIPPLVGQMYGYTNFGIGSSTLGTLNSASKTYRNALIALITGGGTNHNLKILNEHGINDLNSGATSAAVAALRTTFAAFFPNVPVFGTTLTPSTSSTDSFLTTTNQTLGTVGAKVLTFNDLVRAGITGEAGVVDVADFLDPFRSGKWPVSRDPAATTGTTLFTTLDGLHGSPVGHQIIRDRGAGRMALFG